MLGLRQNYRSPSIHSTNIVMKNCAAYGGVTAGRGVEGDYENPW